MARFLTALLCVPVALAMVAIAVVAFRDVPDHIDEDGRDELLIGAC